MKNDKYPQGYVPKIEYWTNRMNEETDPKRKEYAKGRRDDFIKSHKAKYPHIPLEQESEEIKFDSERLAKLESMARTFSDEFNDLEVEMISKGVHMYEVAMTTWYDELTPDIIAHGILHAEKVYREDILKKQAEAEKQGRIYILGEFFPMALNHDIFIKIGQFRNMYEDYAEEIGLVYEEKLF